MSARMFGIVVALLSVWTIAFGLRGVAVNPNVGDAFADFADMYGQKIDPAEWVLHWRTYCTALAIFGFGGLAAGSGIFLRYRWAWIMLAATVVAYLTLEWLAFFTGLSKFAFEQPHAIGSLALLTIGFGALAIHRKSMTNNVSSQDA